MKRVNYTFAIAIISTSILSTIAAIIFKCSIVYFHQIFFDHSFSFSFSISKFEFAQDASFWIIATPTVCSLIVTYLINNFATEAKGHGIPMVVEAIKHKKSYMRPAIIYIKTLASAISIGSGGSTGPEGPTVQICSAIGSLQTYYAKNLTDIQRATLLCCGASSGFAAIFNAPLSGMLFSIELLLPVIELSTIIPIMAAAIISINIKLLLVGPLYIFKFEQLVIDITTKQLFLLAILGILAGIFAALFIKALNFLEKFFTHLKYNSYVKHAAGMLIVGCCLYLMHNISGHYYVEGEGIFIIQQIINGKIVSLPFLLLLFALKFLLTSITLGSGASGGTFSPALFIGACLGGALHIILDKFYLVEGIPQVLFVIAGMASFVGAASGAIITACILMIETTSYYTLFIPIIVSVFFAASVRMLLTKHSIYNLQYEKKSQ